MDNNQNTDKKNGELNDRYAEAQKPCQHLYGLAHPITGNSATQDYVCINCNAVKKGIRS
jgi:hypothetical protein